MTKVASDIVLAVASAGLTALTYQMPTWTGVKASTQWPIAAAVLLMITWGAFRRDGLRVGLFLASIIGIGLGLTAASVVHRAQLGRPLVPGLVMLLAPILCSMFYVKAARGEREADQVHDHLKREIGAIKAMPPEEACKALEAHFQETKRLFEEEEKKEPTYRLRATILISLGLALTVVALPMSIWPAPKPVSLILDVSTLVMCVFWLLKFARRPSV